MRHEFDIEEGTEVVFALGDGLVDVSTAALVDGFESTRRFWIDWSARSTYAGRWGTVVERSALALKLLTHRPSGGLIAAGTTSLPETIGGERNWDYRYVWIRDAAFALYAFMELGYTEEAEAFTGWLQRRLDECATADSNDRQPLRPLYDIDGNAELEEIELDHWAGYADSSPVRIGNAASEQLQLDIYGEIIDSLYLADKHGPGLSLDAWNGVRHLADWVCEHWDQPDDGFWEVRNGPHDFTAARLLCWVALERAMRMARFRGRPADLERWGRSRDAIHACIVERGWSDELGAFTQTLDGDRLDASILLMPLVRFISSHDPRWTSTLEAIGRTLTHDVLVERYEDGTDGLEGDEGTFTICTFWYVEALARAGQVERARLMFDKVLSYAGPLGLFSETISDSGDQLGNFPQAFTHLSLISAAVAIDEAEGR
ncbi:MAG: glycoside hydrolase family 15 protein [Ilumatobacter sp.]|nr:glycoside hydrolase family 15 protein [Ilumatobacter sp.]